MQLVNLLIHSLFHHCVQTGSGAHPASYPTGTGVSFPGGKAAGAWSYLVPKSRMRGAIPPLPPKVFMAWCLVKHGDNFTFSYLLIYVSDLNVDERTVLKLIW